MLTMNKCITDVEYWMDCNYLQLNAEKPEIIKIFGNPSLKIGDVNIALSPNVHNLGVFVCISI